MDNDAPELDALLDQILPGTASPPEPEPAEAPASAEASDATVTAPPSPAPVPAPGETPGTAVDAPPDAAMAARVAALEASLADAQGKAAQFDQLRALAEQKQRDAAEQSQREEWQARIDRLADLSPESAAVERARLVREFEQAQRSQYEPQIAERESVAEEAAKAATASILLAEKYMTPEQFQAFQADHAFMRNFGTPDAMQQQIARDRALELRAYERAKAELGAANEAALVQQAQQRIASNADLVGAGAAGSPATGDPNADPIDAMLDSIFRR